MKKLLASRKTICAALLTSISLSANAGRYYYRHYHYYGPRDDNGGYGLLILVGLVIILLLMVAVTEGLVKKADRLDSYIKRTAKTKTAKTVWAIAIPILFLSTLAAIMLLLNINQIK